MEDKLYIQNIDSFLAELFLKKSIKPLFLRINMVDQDGLLNLSDISSSVDKVVHKKSGIDFELSSCECSGLVEFELADCLNKPVFSSSAFEFFDQVFSKYAGLDCSLELVNGSWKIVVLSFEDN